MVEEAKYVVVGGGIAGVSCLEYLFFLAPDDKTILITASPLIKAVTNIVHITKTLTQFEVEERNVESLGEKYPSVKVIHDTVSQLDGENHCVYTKGGKCIKYEKLCICAGGQPKLIGEGNPFVLGIRDTESVRTFQERIRDARRILVVGNGGIATEVVYEIKGVDIVWAIKDKHISATFIDPGASEFFLPELQGDRTKAVPTKRMKFTVSEDARFRDVPGGALGPDWHRNFEIKSTKNETSNITIEYQCEIKQILSEEQRTSMGGDAGETWPVYAELTNGKVYGCDFIVSATGVIPNSKQFTEGSSLELAEDGGIKVNELMETSIKDVFAAGDVCTASWEKAKHWFQMRLWTQARQMGAYAGRCMVSSLIGEEVIQDFCFELFSHVTKFFGYKVVLLGLYNGQTLDNNYEILLRVTKGLEYVKCILKDGKMQGAVLIGETDLEEMCENLILNQLDLTPFGEELLNPDIDIEDYFD